MFLLLVQWFLLYLENFLKLSSQEMGLIVSAIGFGGFLGQFLVPAASDWIGRRLASILGFIGATIFIYLFANASASIPILFGLLFVLSFFSFRINRLTIRPP